MSEKKPAGRTELTEPSEVTAQRHSIAPRTTLPPRAARPSGVRAPNEAGARALDSDLAQEVDQAA
jgi:hypothetical protein